MYKVLALFAVIACSSAQVLRINPLALGSTHLSGLETIPLHASRLARPYARAYAPYGGYAGYGGYGGYGYNHGLYAPHIAAPIARSVIAPHLAYANEAPEPYTFAYQSADEFGTHLGRSEQADGSGAVTGSYSLAEADGRQRIVEYVADAAGFRANVKTNEPGTANANPADVNIQSSAPHRR